MIESSQIFVSANKLFLTSPCISILGSNRKAKMDRESILDLAKYLNNYVRVELSGGRKGILITYNKLYLFG